MPLGKPIIVDSNILFSAFLQGQSTFANVLLNPDYTFFVCELIVVELFKAKEKIVSYS